MLRALLVLTMLMVILLGDSYGSIFVGAAVLSLGANWIIHYSNTR
jgi:hypothetical protein